MNGQIREIPIYGSLTTWKASGALDAARSGNGSKALELLKTAGGWVFNVATQIGTGLATEAIKAMVLAS